MAVTEETIQLLNGTKIEMNAMINAQTRDLVRSWANSWDTLSADWSRALNDLASGETWPSPTTIRRNRRVLSALSATQEQLNKLAESGAIRINNDIDPAMRLGMDANERVMRSQLPAGQIGASISFNRLDPKAVAAMVRRTTQRVTTLAEKVGPRSYGMMLNELMRGQSLGQNPAAVASRMNARLESRFFNSLHRMNIVSRTEMMDANRWSTNESMKANSDILQGWQWLAELDDRTCPSCWSMHGEIFGLNTPGPEDHQQGRCTSVPATKSWRDLGFDIDEPPSAIQDSQEVFGNLPDDSKLEIMGKARLDALNSGAIQWSELHTYKTNPDWRGSYVVTPVADLLRS